MVRQFVHAPPKEQTRALGRTKVIFLDRDGIINQHRPDYVKRLSEFAILPDVASNLCRLQSAGFTLIIVTNQSAISRGILKVEELEKIHDFMVTELAKQRCRIDGIYYCPHIPEENCKCRKPKTGLMEEAISDFGPIDSPRSWIIGDCDSDIQAGINLGLQTVKITTNGSLNPAVDYILSRLI